MTKVDLYNGISEVKAVFLDEADNYSKTRKVYWGKGIAIAACLCLLLVLLFPEILNSADDASHFFITVHAADGSNNINLEKISVPISLFETESGTKGFVFSYGSEEKEVPSSFIVYNDESLVVNPNEIENILFEDGMHYIFYSIDPSEDIPCTITLCLENNGAKFVVDICVEGSGDELEASLEKLVSYPVLK